MELNDIVTHKGNGIYEIIARAERSRTKFVIRDIDKGKGWCDNTMTYKGIKVKKGWYLGKNYSYGEKLVVHQKTLNKKQKPK